MASRKFRIGGVIQSWGQYIQSQKDNNHSDFTSITDERDVVLKVGKDGSMEPITGEPGADDIVFSGSKSNLRRIADIERNVSILAAKLTTTDGEATDTNDDDFDTVVNKDTKFKKDVQLGNSSSDDITVGGALSIDSTLTLGTSAKETLQDLIGGMVTGNTESGITVTYDDSSNEFDFDITSAPKWETARTITLGGDASGSVSIDGTANVSLSVAIGNDSHTHDTRYYTKTQVDTEIDNHINAVVDAAPGTLNTLNELAAALGDDANFASTTTANIAAKVDKTSAQAMRATDALTVSNDTITIHKGDGTSESVTVSDANSDNYLTGASFSTSNGVLTLTRTNGNVTVDLDGRFTDNGYADTMNQHVRTTDSPTFANVTATAFNGTATYAKYADLAERYAADAEYAEGTVMAFGGDAEVTAAAGYASGKLAGVVSHKPAVAMNAEAGDDATHPFIALQGRVPVRVEGDVKKGDILVASDIAGLAAVWMNEDADPRMTAYVGIAISDSADGMVEVKVGK